MAKGEMPAIAGLHNIATHHLRDDGTVEQKQRWLPRATGGEMLAAIATAEPGCGSDLKTISTKVRREADHYFIDDAETFISNGFTCNLLVVAARTGEAGSRCLSLIVPETQNLPGFRVGRLL